MIKIYGMKTCPDCMAVEEQVKGDSRYQVIDIGEHVRHLKAFLQLRDNSPAFAEAKRMGYAGIPCFVLEDGIRPAATDAPSCRLDGSGC